jgi:hypothetical protein
LSKVSMSRWRLIWASSIVDQTLERFLYYEVAKREISDWQNCPSKPGMGSDDHAVESIYKTVLEMAKYDPPNDDDVSGWDMQVKRWLMITAEFSYLMQLPFSPSSDYVLLCCVRGMTASRPVLCTSSGTLFRVYDPRERYIQMCDDPSHPHQVFWEMMKFMLSGRFVTSWLNSRMRVCLAALLGNTAIAMGDDCIECGPTSGERLRLALETLGFPAEVKVHAGPEGITFCSMRLFSYEDGTIGFVPARWDRTLYTLLSKKVIPPEEVVQFMRETRHVALSADFKSALWELASV